jgi:hypothetical protein
MEIAEERLADGRMAHWRAAAPDLDPAGVAALADAFRLTGGTIRRAAVAVRVITLGAVPCDGPICRG